MRNYEKIVLKPLDNNSLSYQDPHSTGEMADSTEGDTMYLGILAPALIALIAGLVIHSFIIVVNVKDWRRGRSVTPVDLVITSLGISRMCNQCAVTLWLFEYTVFLNNPNAQNNLLIIAKMYYFFSYANFLLTSLLSFVLCLKISSLSTRLFLYLRRMIEQGTAYVIVALVLLSAFNCLLSMLPAITEATKGGTYNTTKENVPEDCTFINSLYSHTISAFITLLFYFISSVVLFGSLYHHTRRIKMSGNLSINLETYYSAMKCIFFTFIYNIIFLISHFISIFYFYLYCVVYEWLYIVLGFLPALHSCYLIYRTAKLRSQISKILQNVMDFLFQRKDPETREDIEVVAQ